MGSIPVRVTSTEKQDKSPAFSFFVLVARTLSNPLARTKGFGSIVDYRSCGYQENARIGFETLLRRFRVGSLVRRSKFPYLFAVWVEALI